jgi:hypothetical protein
MDDKVLEYLKHNFGEDTKSIMKDTVFERRTIIRRYLANEKIEGLEKITNLMPRLFDVEGNVRFLSFNYLSIF